jgi:hypothetical protein
VSDDDEESNNERGQWARPVSDDEDEDESNSERGQWARPVSFFWYTISVGKIGRWANS